MTNHDTRDNIELSLYEPTWPINAAAEITVIRDHLRQFSWFADLHHIGSTAVPGCTAKPVLDIMIGVSDLTPAQAAVPILESLGYLFWADNPKQDRMFFVKGMPPYGERRTHHVHIFNVESYEYFARRLFRDYLIANNQSRDTYIALKHSLALRYSNDREAYTSAKTEFVTKTVLTAIAAELQFLPLAREHFPLITEWFNQAHVQQFYSLRSWTLDEVAKKHIPYIDGLKSVQGYMVLVKDTYLGYIQKYTFKDYPLPEYQLTPELLSAGAGIDIFIGAKDFVGRGLGQVIVEGFLNREIWPYFRYCIADPDVRNHASIKMFEKCSFTKERTVTSKDALGRPVDLTLMVRKHQGHLANALSK
jgi:GrpB-like predicted nucleotidyltransferase (UPF0157 family)